MARPTAIPTSLVLLPLLLTATRAHTDALGFACVQRGDADFDVTVCYGSWHSDEPPAEGALSLYAATADATALDAPSSYTVEAYGAGGHIRDATNAFQDPFDVSGHIAWECDGCGWPQMSHKHARCFR